MIAIVAKSETGALVVITAGRERSVEIEPFNGRDRQQTCHSRAIAIRDVEVARPRLFTDFLEKMLVESFPFAPGELVFEPQRDVRIPGAVD
jgi:hypothetical protein